MIIGTSGHIDHGKTALVKALTGVDADRLKEEKARGITIDLGFAYLPIESGDILGFIDVPGHERLVHTMLAGAGGIDYALLVIAADDGVMPQTREHLAIIDLLGISNGIVALSKADLASAERLVEISRQIRDVLAGTTLADAEILPVSTVSGEGIDAFRARLVAAARVATRHAADSRFRLAVDRCFTLTGVGVVVTGTVLSGSVTIDDQVVVSPSGLKARVRSMHVQNRPAQRARAGDRCALNLAGDGITKDAIQRGNVVLTPSLHAPTDRIDARLRLLSSEAKSIRQWQPVRLHHAAAEVGAHVVLLDDKPLAPGEEADVQLVLDHSIATAVPDRFVIRDASAHRTIGGGSFIDLRPPQRRRRTPERQAQRAALAIADHTEALAALLQTSPFAWDITAFLRDRARPESDENSLIRELQLVALSTGATRVVLTITYWRQLVSDIIAQLTTFHAENPDRQGIGRELLRLSSKPRLTVPVFTVALARMAADREIVPDGAFVRLASHSVRMLAKDEEAWDAIAPLLAGETRFRPPRVRDIANETGRPERDVRRLLKLAGRMGRVDEVAHDHFFLRDTVHEMVGIVADLSAAAHDGSFTAAQFRDRVENGRKVAIQILDFFDRHGVTLNRDDIRRVNKHRVDLFGPLVQSSSARNGRGSSPVGCPDFKSG
ncbi:selenocysteine-specific translation elongation factor [Bradyrhizobium sp. STM 3557]|uniref:selenocysteine-specific translation elongation factor n=1 Tax=Bradyrhizobium sp. STM 3557 TaxID=578920 RepID=UPI00388E9A0A